LLPTLTEGAFAEWRSDREFRAAIRAKREHGEKLDTEIPNSIMRCVCGETFDSHKPEQSFPHRRHIYAAQATKRQRRLILARVSFRASSAAGQENESFTRSIAGCDRFFTLTQSLDRPPR
jgi:hypothetical protein